MSFISTAENAEAFSAPSIAGWPALLGSRRIRGAAAVAAEPSNLRSRPKAAGLIRIATALTCALFLAGCLPVTSKSPVGTTMGLGADPVLIGTWKGHSPDTDNKTDGYFHFMAAKDGSLTIAVIMAAGGSDDGWTIFNARTAVLGKNRFLNAVETFDKDAPAEGSLKNANIPLLYVVKGRTLTLYLLDEDKSKEAIKAGKIAGTIEPGESGDVEITAEPAALDAFMATPEAAVLFKVMMVLKKVE
jgi:hypothetical protein